MAQTKWLVGFHAITAKIKQNPNSIIEIYWDSQRHDQRLRDLTQLVEAKQLRAFAVEAKKLDLLVGHTKHQGVIAKVEITQYQSIDAVLENLQEPALLLILDGIQDPHNLGACLRVADAMGAHAVIAPKDRAVGLNATVAKVASGAAETVPYIAVTNLARTMRELKEYGIWIAGTAADASIDLYHFTPPTALAWVMGAEGDGMRRLTREHCDVLVNIPMFGSVESLNVSVSAGICLNHARQYREKSAI